MATAVERNVLIPVVRRQADLLGPLLAFLFFYTVAFPKGGIKILGIPLTIGYLLTAAMLLLAMLRGRHVAIPLDRLLAYLPCLLLGLWSALVVHANGTDAVGLTISYFVSALYLPLFGLIFFSSLVLDDQHRRIERTLVWAVRFIATYGIFLFLYRQFTGHWIEIPYLTVNAADVGTLDDKYINRGGIFKLISSYNNGNVFGVSVAIMAPLYFILEKKPVFRWILYSALFLTLSRTAWIAAILIIVLRSLSRGVRPLTIVFLAIGMMLACAAIFSLLDFLGRDLSFILDSNLGGRVKQFNLLEDISFIPSAQVSSLPEIVYIGMIRYFGIPGLLLFVGHLLTAPTLLKLEGVQLFSTSPASACMQGMLIYFVIAGADSAFSLIPVMMIFWMIAGIGFWYAHRDASSARERYETAR